MQRRALEDTNHKARFERSKAFSDYLGFHIRLVFFLVISVFALAIPVTAMLAELNGGPTYSVAKHIPELTVMLFCSALSLVMLYHIFGVGRSYLLVHVPKKPIRLLLYPFYWIATIGALTAISMYGSFQLARTIGVNPFQLECDMNRYLSSTNYPFTPVMPARCK